jgi:hypothetical protein
MLRDVAQAAAGELYEVLMGDNLVRAEWQKQNPGLTEKQLTSRFVAKNWGKCLEFARATLALTLRQPIDTKTKDAIMEALRLDNQLLRGRRSGMDSLR